MPRAVAAPAPSSDAARREEAKAAFGRGNAAYNLGKYGEAIGEFEKAYALSRLPDILFNLGQCYRKQWETDKRSELGRRALHYYEALVREGPSSRVRPDAEQFIAELSPAVAAAEAQERQGQIAAARGAEALKLAQSMFVAGQLQDAAGVLDRLLREPDNGRELLAEGYLLRGRVAAGLGDSAGRRGAVPAGAGAAAGGRDPRFRAGRKGRHSRRRARPPREAGCASCRRRSARSRRTGRPASTSKSRGTRRRWSRRWSSGTGAATAGRS